MELIDVLKKRYSTKKFDPTKKISNEDFQCIKDLLRFSPSSVNSQPWHFVIVNTDEGKAKISKSTQGMYAFNDEKVWDASHVVVFCAKTHIDEAYVHHLLDQEEEDGRFTEPQMKKDQFSRRFTFVDIHRYELKDLQHWMEKQVYLNMGMFLLGVATLGIDAVPMEGFDAKILDNELGLREKGYTAIGLVALGYHSEDDFNVKLPKSRLSEDEIITIL